MASVRVRTTVEGDGRAAARQAAEALLIAIKYLLKLDPAAHVPAVSDLVGNYMKNAMVIREDSVRTYGVGKGRTTQITTPGVYADSLLGRCSACEPQLEARQYVEVMRLHAEQQQVERSADLLEAEVQRRRKRLDADNLEPFEPPDGEPA
jgi:hypothetical protein